MDPERFEQLVEEALEGLPQTIASRLDNVDVTVERAPPRETLRRLGLGRGRTLLGLYHGVPQTRRGPHYGGVLPDRIVIYRGPVLAAAREEAGPKGDLDEAVREQVRRTVLHEIGHHFGLGERDLRDAGY